MDKAPVVLDGRTLFEVGAAGTWTAEQRADEISCLLRDAIAAADPIVVELTERDGDQTIRLGPWQLLTVMDSDVVPGMDPSEQARRWASTVRSAELRARQERTAPYLAGAGLRTLAAIVVAAALHWLLGRLRRRLRSRLTRRAARAPRRRALKGTSRSSSSV